MKYLTTYLRIVALLPLLVPVQVLAQTNTAHQVLISEVQTGSQISASEEFIELYNNGTEPVDLTGWGVQYRSAAGSLWQNKASLEGVLYPGGYYLLTANTYLAALATQPFYAGLAKTGGQLRLVRTVSSLLEVRDLVGWGTAQIYEGSSAAPAPAESQSLNRKYALPSHGAPIYIDTDDNAQDFQVSLSPIPDNINVAAVIQVDNILLNSFLSVPYENTQTLEQSQAVPDITNTTAAADNINLDVPISVPEVYLDTDISTANSESTGLELSGNETIAEIPAIVPFNIPIAAEEVIIWPLMITEILPNPAKPLIDADNEYIELHNSGSSAVQLEGFVLQSGLTSGFSYTIGKQVLEPGGYAVFTSKATRLTMSNSAGKVRLLTPDKTLVHETAAYKDARDGLSWNWNGSDWQWSSTPTPGVANVIQGAARASSKFAKAAKEATLISDKKTTPKKSKVKSTAAASVGKTKKAAATGKVRKEYQEPEKVSTKSPLHYGVLALVASLAVVYAAYEYRKDLANRIFQLRRNLAYRRNNRRAVEGL